MRSSILALFLLAMPSVTFAAPCSETPIGPCTPDEGTETDEAESFILKNIEAAQLREPDVKAKKSAYEAVRNNANFTAAHRMAIFEEYRTAQMEQDELYAMAANKTAELYHVRPKQTGPITIGEPEEADMKYMTGSTATWNPQVTDSGPGVKLAVRIDGNDGPHYSGATELDPLDTDPKKPNQRLAVTLPDGRVFIMKDTFKIAVDKGKLGFLASVIYHETRHYNRLSWKDKEGRNRSWSTNDKEERDAYKANKRMAEEAFGLDQEDIDALESQYRAYANAVKTGKPLFDDNLTPAQEAAWKNYYENEQINLEDEFFKLSKEVEIYRAKQLEIERREELERQAKLAAERLERERADQEQRVRDEERLRQAKRTVEFYERQDFLNEIARCYYRPIYMSGSEGKIIGFHDDDAQHYCRDDNETPSIDGMNILMLITRACDDVRRGVPPDKHKACNDAAPKLRNPLRYDLLQKIEQVNRGWNAECANTILANRARINDSRSFEKIVADFHKADNKKKAEKAKRKRREKERNEREEDPGGGSRPPERNKHYWDQSCQCWVTEY